MPLYLLYQISLGTIWLEMKAQMKKLKEANVRSLTASLLVMHKFIPLYRPKNQKTSGHILQHGQESYCNSWQTFTIICNQDY